MARSTALATLAVFAMAAALCGRAFVSAPAPRSLRGDAAAAVAAGTIAGTAPMAAHAFTYKGVEYFDVTFGIDPFWWFVLGFSILFFGATVRNAVMKTYKTVRNDEAGVRYAPPRAGGFVGKEVENEEPSYKI